MTRHSFDVWRRRQTGAGQRHLANTIRTLVLRSDESLFDLLDFDDDAQFLCPALFAYFTDPAPPVDAMQILYGLMPQHRRPSRIELRTDANGRASLGPLGTIATDRALATLAFSRESEGAPYVCAQAGRSIAFQLRTPLTIPGTRVAATLDIDPLFRRFFDLPGGALAGTQAISAPSEALSRLLIAAALMQAHCAAIWREIASVTQTIVLFAAGRPNSFAALSCHGAIFCNTRIGDSELALLEDLAHQGAHVLFNALSPDPRRLLTVDPETPVQQVAGAEGRSIYVALHALFTYATICRVLTGVYEASILSELRAHEVLGRLGLTLQKFEWDLALLDQPSNYTLAGRRCFEAFAAELALYKARYGARVRFDYRDQPYVFDYRIFVLSNGGPWPAACEMAS